MKIVNIIYIHIIKMQIIQIFKKFCLKQPTFFLNLCGSTILKRLYIAAKQLTLWLEREKIGDFIYWPTNHQCQRYDS